MSIKDGLGIETILAISEISEELGRDNSCDESTDGQLTGNDRFHGENGKGIDYREMKELDRVVVGVAFQGRILVVLGTNLAALNCSRAFLNFWFSYFPPSIILLGELKLVSWNCGSSEVSSSPNPLFSSSVYCWLFPRVC